MIINWTGGWRRASRLSHTCFPFCRCFCIRFGADTVAMLTKISEEPASFTACNVCHCVWDLLVIVHEPRLFQKWGPLPVSIAAMVFSLLPHAYLSALLLPHLSAPGWLWVASRSTNRKPRFVETNLPLSSFTPPSTMASFLLWRSGMKKEKQMKWGWRRRTSTAATIGRALVTVAANRSTTSELAKQTSAVAERRLMKRVGVGQNDGRTRLEEDRGGHGRDGLKWSIISMGDRGGWRKWKRGSSFGS